MEKELISDQLHADLLSARHPIQLRLAEAGDEGSLPLQRTVLGTKVRAEDVDEPPVARARLSVAGRCLPAVELGVEMPELPSG